MIVGAGYGQTISNQFNQSAFLRQLGYTNALSSSSSYNLFGGNMAVDLKGKIQLYATELIVQLL